MLAAESLPTPGRGIGNAVTEEHIETVDTRLRGEGRCRIRLRRAAQDAPHLSGDRVEQNGHGKICVAVQRRGAMRPGESDIRQVTSPVRLNRENENER